MSACKGEPEIFIAELVEDGVVTKTVVEALKFLERKQFLERIEYALALYSDETHFSWSEYKRQVVSRLDDRFGEGWRTA